MSDETIEIKVETIDNTKGGGGNVIIDALAETGMVIAEEAAMITNLAYANTISSNNLSAQNQLANQNALNRVHTSVLADAVNQVQNNQPLAARSAVDVLSSNELAQMIADLKAAVDAFAAKALLAEILDKQ